MPTMAKDSRKKLPTMTRKWPTYIFLFSIFDGTSPTLRYAAGYPFSPLRTTPKSSFRRWATSSVNIDIHHVGIGIPRTRSVSRTKLDTATALSLEGDKLLPSTWGEVDETLAEIKDPKVGVLLLNLGGPETGEDVEGVLK